MCHSDTVASQRTSPRRRGHSPRTRMCGLVPAGEEDGVDYHFRPRAEIEALREHPGYVLVNVRGDLQALEIDSVRRIVDDGFDPLFEGNPFIPTKLRQAGRLPAPADHA